MYSAIIIPARFGSTRFPGKPLHMIAGKTLLQRVCDVAAEAARGLDNVQVCVATDDERILAHAQALGVKAVMTPEHCPTGTDRVLHASLQLDPIPDFVVNLQGDAPLTPPSILRALLLSAKDADPDVAVFTPAVRLSWQELDQFRHNKIKTPFSGTTVVMNDKNDAFWFSKNIIPAIRQEEKWREKEQHSPVYQHLGVYAYFREALTKYVTWSETLYERCEGLEQLRWLMHGYRIRVVPVELPRGTSLSGVDTLEDARRVENFLNENASENKD